MLAKGKLARLRGPDRHPSQSGQPLMVLPSSVPRIGPLSELAPYQTNTRDHPSLGPLLPPISQLPAPHGPFERRLPRLDRLARSLYPGAARFLTRRYHLWRMTPSRLLPTGSPRLRTGLQLPHCRIGSLTRPSQPSCTPGVRTAYSSGSSDPYYLHDHAHPEILSDSLPLRQRDPRTSPSQANHRAYPGPFYSSSGDPLSFRDHPNAGYPDSRSSQSSHPRATSHDSALPF